MAKTVLITGVAGFLGRYIVREFAQADWRVVGVDVAAAENAPAGTEYYRLTLPSDDLVDLIARVAPDACIHCAGRASVPLSMRDPAADFRDGTVLTFELLDALRRAAPECRTVIVSSAAVYGNPLRLPIDEAQPTVPLSPYGYHKVLCELLADEFFRLFGLPTAVIRIFSAFGPGLRRQVVWDICERVLTSKSLKLFGTGNESRDFVHAGDVARALAVIVESAPFTAEIYNVATGVEVTIRELADRLVHQLGSNIAPEFNGVSKEGDPLNWRADISKLQALGFTPGISLADGLRSVATWASAELMTAP